MKMRYKIMHIPSQLSNGTLCLIFIHACNSILSANLAFVHSLLSLDWYHVELELILTYQIECSVSF